MADPLSLAASIAGLISLADLVFKTTYKFVRAAKDAKDEIQSLLDEINNLSSVLRRLEALTSDLEDEGQSFDPTLRNHYLNHCYKTFNRIELRVKKASDSFKKSKLDGIVRQLKWPFSSSETKELLAELSRHKETISVALLADSMRKIQLSLSKSEEINRKITALGEVARRIEINTMIAINDRKKRILDHFMKANPQPALQTSIRLRHSMTGLWLTESPTFIRWLETPGSKLWLTGIPGAGKTVLAGSVIQEALTRSYNSRKIGVAFFFCDYKDSKTWDTVNILGALASQLARQNEESYNILDAYHEVLYPPKGLPQTADADELRARISQMCVTFDQTIIVVDGLDECDDMTDEVVDNLIQLADYSDGLSMALFSRDHYNIRVRLEEEFETIQIAAHTEDVELYVIAEVDKRIRTRQLQLASADMKEEIRSALVGKADGIWVVCQLDYLCNCAHDQERREALSKLPPDLPESYRRLLERVNNYSVGVQNMVQMCLHFMAMADPKLTIVELQQAVSTTAIGGTLNKDNIVPEYEIMKRCSSLIRKSTDGEYFEFAHFSVREFLEDEKAIFRTTGIEKYWIAQSATNYLLATQCLKFIQMDNFDKIPDDPEQQVAATRQRDEDFPFYRHAALLWIKLTKDGLGDADILELAKHLFQPSKRAYFMCWAVEVFKNVMYATGIGSRYDPENETEVHAWRIVMLPSFKPLHMASALNLPEICSFLISNGSDVNDKLDAATSLDLALMSVLAIPGLATMSGEKSQHRHLMITGRNEFLPSTQRRDMTIDCLMHAGARASDHLIPPNSLSIFSIVCLLASIFHDLYPVFRCLYSHTIPSVPEVKVLQEWLMATDASNLVAEVSARMLLKFLSSTGAYNTDWGAELGLVVWNWAQECDFSLTKDLSLVGSCALMSDDNLVSQIVSAVCSDNVELLKYCVADRRLKNQVRYSGPVNGLLHLAAKHNSFGVFKALVIAGFDACTQNDRGELPIHLCERQGSLRPFKIFKDLGLSLISQDQYGYSILHYWAQDRPLNYGFLDGIFELDPEEVIEGLQARTPQGDTPLTLIFESAGESTRSEHQEIDLNRLCLQILGLLQRRNLEKRTGIRLMNGMGVNCLRKAFPEFDNMIDIDPTPLHKLKAWVSLSQVQLLITLYPDAVNSRVKGKLPLEGYIENTLNNRKDPEHDIMMSLFPDNEQNSESSDKESLWSFACHITGRYRNISCRKYVNGKYIPPFEFETMMAIMMQLGAMRIYEKQSKESGLKPLLSKYHPSLLPVIRNAILQTDYWDGMQSSDSISALFQDAIKSSNLDMIQLLIQKGANPHHRANGHTPFEIAFRADIAIEFCKTEEGAEALKSLLDCGRGNISEVVKESSEADNGSPLHTLATTEDATNIIWLAEALVQRGLDINYVGSGLYGETPLVYHLQKSSFQFAEKLLELGADPYARGETSLNAVFACVVIHNLPFLQKILDRGTQRQKEICWPDPLTFNIRHLGQTAVVNNGNALHWATTCNNVACLELLLENASEAEKASISDEGLTPVHIAAYEGHVDVLKLLLQKGFSTTTENRFGLTPMHMAILGGSLPTVQCLLEYGAPQTLDASGRTPGRLAFELRFDGIYELLEGGTRGGYQRISYRHVPIDFEEPMERLAMAFERAMKEEDYESMRQLIEKGCPVDVPLQSGQGASAFLLAVEDENFVMGEWLLQQGASALQAYVKVLCVEGVIDIAAGLSSLNPLLPELFQKYFLEGGDLRFGREGPIHEAVFQENTRGLEILLEVAEENVKRITEVFTNVQRHPEPLVDGGFLLQKQLRDLDTYCKYDSTAHGCMHLVSLGASMAAVCRLGSLESLINWFDGSLFDGVHPVSFSRLPKQLLTLSTPPRFSTVCQRVSVTTETLGNMSKLNFDLLSEDEMGRSMMHYILGEEDLLGWVLDREQDLSGTTPFPWHLEWCGFSGLALLTSSFKRLQKEVPSDLFRKVLNLEPSRGWSPLCHAAALNRADIVANCLEMGADIDFEGSCFGSAVMNASACGSLDAVKLLARNGASLTYMSKRGFISCFLVAGTEAVRQWLLCGQFMDQKRLAAERHWDLLKEEVPWGGYVEARVLLYGTRARWPAESTLDYAKRLSRMKKMWQGEVLQLYVEEEASSSSGMDSDTEFEGDAASNSEVESESESVLASKAMCSQSDSAPYMVPDAWTESKVLRVRQEAENAYLSEE
ncbi:ankyrin repeat [Fusarium sp. NRRL 52700]|nr:ankyrin repeat [Fusarium sp. NRRL 52700]